MLFKALFLMVTITVTFSLAGCAGGNVYSHAWYDRSKGPGHPYVDPVTGEQYYLAPDGRRLTGAGPFTCIKAGHPYLCPHLFR